MSEEKEKPITLTLKITMPTKETIASAIQKLFPFSNLYDIKVSVEEEKPKAPVGGSSAPVATPAENMTGYETPVAPPGTVFETPTRKQKASPQPEESPPVKTEA